MINPFSLERKRHLKLRNRSLIILLCFIIFINIIVIINSYSNGYARKYQLKSLKTGMNGDLISNIIPESSQTSLSGEENGISWVITENHSSAFLNPYLVLSFTCDRTVNILIAIAGIEGATTSKITPESVLKSDFSAGSHEVMIPIHMTLDALPGEYIFILSVEFRDSNNNSLITVAQVERGRVLYLGGTLILIFLLISIISISFLIISRSENLKKEPSPTTGADAVYVPGTTAAASEDKESDISINVVGLGDEEVKSGFIKCPDCHKEIPEGSSFCPECGFHIPKFLRVGGGAQE